MCGIFILTWTLRNRMGWCGLYLAYLGQKQVAGCFEHGIEPLGTKKEGGIS
jgi:hypothetical protein